MAKYSTKFKCKLVGRYLEGKESYESLAIYLTSLI